MNLNEKLARLRPKEVQSVAYIMRAVAMIIEASVECPSPDDARIALCLAISTIFSTVANQTPMSQARMAEISVEFTVDAILGRRKKK